MTNLKYSSCKCLMAAVLFSCYTSANADGMLPETSLLIIDEATHSGIMNLKNTDDVPLLLYTTIQDLPDDTGTKVIVTQPVVRVEPGQNQQVRFILQSDKPLTCEHFKRVVFEGIPPKKDGKTMKISFNVEQNLPVLIRPANLAVVTDAWKYLEWSRVGDHYSVKNPSNYVVRLANHMIFKPSQTTGNIKKSYILPGETLPVVLEKDIRGDTEVQFFPASRYGVEVPSFTTELKK
ncbi:fimbrial chaperone protein [Escherichia coli]|nr:fimbria/pilus periplasmic chaperone [Escherichia coli]EFO2788161.1 fimbrial chaperone protein [Escherichia coli]MDN1905598.1 fimbrial chaperone protein [Escherichia coli]HAW0817024.1 fimbria/pilus periplasmic chaperone [Escherichia coli]